MPRYVPFGRQRAQSKKAIALGVLATLVTIVHMIFRLRTTKSTTFRHLETPDVYCDSFPKSETIGTIIKTGATMHAKLPTQLATSLRCASNLLIFSDLHQRVGDYDAIDVLSRVSPSELRFNKDFEIYHIQQKYVALGRENDIVELRNLPATSDDPRARDRKAAWVLDKYKFLHMVERSWELMPYMDWYLYVEADTYVNWPNLSRWLAGLNPERRLYIGSPILLMQYPSTLYFAHGGAGIILSGAAVREFAVEHKDIANKWDERVSKMWYGDAALARALHEDLDLDLTHAHLSMTTDEPQNIAFREEIWCRPVLTLHHCKPEHLEELSQFEVAYNYSSSVATYRDLYAFFLPDGLPQNRENWHNMARDDGSLDWSATLDVKPKNKGTHLNLDLELLPPELEDPHESFEGCRLACHENEYCYQFLFVTTVTKTRSPKDT